MSLDARDGEKEMPERVESERSSRRSSHGVRDDQVARKNLLKDLSSLGQKTEVHMSDFRTSSPGEGAGRAERALEAALQLLPKICANSLDFPALMNHDQFFNALPVVRPMILAGKSHFVAGSKFAERFGNEPLAVHPFDAVKELDKTRMQAPDAVKELGKTRMQAPDAVKGLDKTRMQAPDTAKMLDKTHNVLMSGSGSVQLANVSHRIEITISGVTPNQGYYEHKLLNPVKGEDGRVLPNQVTWIAGKIVNGSFQIEQARINDGKPFSTIGLFTLRPQRSQ